MTWIQRLTLWAALHFLKLHHFRVSGWADDTVFAAGDALLSPTALRFFNGVHGAKEFSWKFEQVKKDEGFTGIEPPVIITQRD